MYQNFLIFIGHGLIIVVNLLKRSELCLIMGSDHTVQAVHSCKSWLNNIYYHPHSIHLALSRVLILAGNSVFVFLSCHPGFTTKITFFMDCLSGFWK